MSLAKTGHIIDALRHERYRFQPARRIYIRRKTAGCGRSACHLGRISLSAK
jgi:hypothetical protein